MKMLSWFGKGKNLAGGGYRKDRPPEDDCCPICFDDFHVPCRTNCGHWFCGSCLVRFSKFMANFQLCKCPMCESWIYNLVPYTPVMIQPGREEVSEILREIEQYNRENELGREVGELLGGMKQHDRQHKVGFSFFTKYGDLIDRVDVVMDTIFSTIRFITLLMHIVHTIYDLRLWPNEGIEFRLAYMLRCALLLLTIWMNRRWLRDRLPQ
ncbi:uncharacterized protein LOC121761185 [Salvia splendens]|uniref:uncharacterized protein LOC121761185 n=1 Tax=Salvia splendens TaxID=180675 RepID=UPI001C26AEDD|nr:uncharacterized protein LOC121761185 [Salvia splendens]